MGHLHKPRGRHRYPTPWGARAHNPGSANTPAPLARAPAIPVLPPPQPAQARLPAHAHRPGSRPRRPPPADAPTQLSAWCDQSTHRDDALRDARATTVTARDAAEALRGALARLDLEVERAAGGTRSPTYASWAAVAGQLG